MRALAYFFFSFIFFPSWAHEGTSQIKFVENKNQWPVNVLYKAQISGGNIFFEQNRITYDFYDLSNTHISHNHNRNQDTPHKRTEPVEDVSDIIKGHSFNVTFMNASLTAELEPSGAYSDISNYYIGNDPSKWASNVKSFNKLKYKSIYDGIDLILFEKNDALKYEFHVSPGRGTEIIKLQYNGVDDISLKNGELHIITSIRTVIEKKPFVYQLINGKLTIVPCIYKLTDNIVSFEFPEGYDLNEKLIIDPEIVFSTFSGSTADNWGFTATYDDDGHLYTAGIVFDNGFPVSPGAYQDRMNNNINNKIDIGILKFSPDGKNRIYGTYLGGRSSEVPISLVVNSKNQLIIYGVTGSDNFPLSANPFRNNFRGGPPIELYGIQFSNGTDMFISKLSPNGNNLSGSTYMGDTGNDGLVNPNLRKNYGDGFRGEVITDDEDNIYVASSSNSNNFPKSASFPPFISNSSFAVVFKLNDALSNLIFSTHLGGNGVSAAYSLVIDKEKNVYVTGGTSSSNFAGLNRPNTDIDGIVVKLSPNGTELLNRRYLGTTSYDQCYFIQLDTEENIFLLGQTQGRYPVSSNVFHNPNSGIFIQKLDRDFNPTVSTVIGTGGFQPNISPTAFMISDCNKIFLAGWGGSQNNIGSTMGLPITNDAFQNRTNGSDFYLMMLDEDAKGLLYSTFFGGSGAEHVDGGTSRFDKKGIIYHAVCACGRASSTFPIHPQNVYSPQNQSNESCNNAAFKFSITGVEVSLEATPTRGCVPLTVNFNSSGFGSKGLTWDMGDGNVLSTRRPGFPYQYKEAGTYVVQLIANNPISCIVSDTAEVIIEVLKVDIEMGESEYLHCYPDTSQIFVQYKNGHTYQWTPASGLDNPGIHNPKAFPENTSSYELTVRNEEGCEDKKTVIVNVARLDQNLEYENITDCTGKPKIQFNNNSNEYFQFSWNFGDGNISNEQSPLHEYQDFDRDYQVSLNISNAKCFAEDTAMINIPEVYFPNLITPNGDGKNDKYEIKGMTQDWHFDVYNRWGKPVYKSQSYDNEWGGEGLNDGIYFYLISTPRGIKCKGWVDIKR